MSSQLRVKNGVGLFVIKGKETFQVLIHFQTIVTHIPQLKMLELSFSLDETERHKSVFSSRK
jgi:hypothetical protein